MEITNNSIYKRKFMSWFITKNVNIGQKPILTYVHVFQRFTYCNRSQVFFSFFLSGGWGKGASNLSTAPGNMTSSYAAVYAYGV